MSPSNLYALMSTLVVVRAVRMGGETARHDTLVCSRSILPSSSPPSSESFALRDGQGLVVERGPLVSRGAQFRPGDGSESNSNVA